MSEVIKTRQRSNTVPCKPRRIKYVVDNIESPIENTPNNTPVTPYFKPTKIDSVIDEYELSPPSLKVYDQSKMLLFIR